MLLAPVGHNGSVSQTIEAPVRAPEREERDVVEPDRPWIVIVWNDPVNLMTYVTLVFRKLFGYTEQKATQLMLQVTTRARRSSRAVRTRRRSTTSPGCTLTGSGRPCSRISPAVALRRPLRVLGNDEYALDLATDERTVLRRLCEELRPLVAGQDETVGRLFPAAYRDDPDASAEYDRLVRESLVSDRLRALDTVLETVDQEPAEPRPGRGVVRRPQRHPPRPR